MDFSAYMENKVYRLALDLFMILQLNLAISEELLIESIWKMFLTIWLRLSPLLDF